jgi:hypothetical protein
MGRNPPHHTPGTLKALPDNLGSWFSVRNLILTQLIRRPTKKWKTTSKNKKMEDDFKKNQKKLPIFFEKIERRPQKNGRWPKKKRQSTKINLIGCDTIVNSPSFLIKDNISKMEDDLDFF